MLVRRVEDVLELLEFYAEFQKPATISEVSQHFGWPRSSTFNILTTMSSRGYLYESGGKGQYYPTSRLFRVAQSINAGAPNKKNAAINATAAVRPMFSDLGAPSEIR